MTHSHTIHGYKVHIVPDEDAPSPREDAKWNHIISWRFDFDAHTFESADDFLAHAARERLIVLPVFMDARAELVAQEAALDLAPDLPDFVGFAYVYLRDIEGEWQKWYFRDVTLGKIKKLLRMEVYKLSAWRAGQVWKLVIEDPRGEVIAERGGYYFEEPLMRLAHRFIDRHRRRAKKRERAEKRALGKHNKPWHHWTPRPLPQPIKMEIL